MRIAIFILALLFYVTELTGQVVVTSNLPIAGVTTKSQLWNISILDMGVLPHSITIEMTFSNPNTGERIFNATSREITINNPVTTINFQAVQPIVINVLNTAYGINAEPDGFLPLGQYEVCYAIFQQTNESPEKLAETCDGLEIEPMSPPNLINPENEDVIDQLHPFFSWTAPNPVGQFSGLTYELKLVEVFPTQSPLDAVGNNIPIYSVSSLNDLFHAYPMSQADLDSSKLYAWQVSALSSNQAVAKSEVNVFKVKLYGIDSIHTGHGIYYTPLSRSYNSSFITVSKSLNLSYLNEMNEREVTYNILSIDGNSSNWIFSSARPLTLMPGENYFKIDISSIDELIENNFYEFQLHTRKGEIWRLKFQYKSIND